MKKFIKSIWGNIYCFIHRVKRKGRVYLGKRIKIIGGGVTLEEGVTITSDNFICASKKGKIKICEGTTIGQYSRIAASNKVEIGKDVLTGPNVFIADYNHEYRNVNIPIKYQGECNSQKNKKTNSVIIGDGTWIGTNAVIVGNVHVGKNVVIGANSLVNKNIPDYCVVGGVPAKIIKYYDINRKEWRNNNG